MANVPRVPGVPNLTSYSAVTAVFLVADAVALLISALSGPQWGIFLDGESVIEADNVVSFELKQDSPISDYPVEEMGFQSYDKVQLPTDIRMRVSAGGSVTNRQRLLASIAAEMNTIDLYDVLTPEAVYIGYNFVHQDFKRAADRGAGLLVVDIWLQEVRESQTSTFTQTQQPGDAGTQSSGNVQPQTPPTAIESNFSSGLWQVT